MSKPSGAVVRWRRRRCQGSRWQCSEASPHFSVYGIGSSARVCGESCSMAIVGLHAPTTPLYLYSVAQRGAHCHTWQTSPIRARIELVFQFWRSFLIGGDYIPNILPLDLHISSLFDNPLIHKSVHRTHYIMITSYVLSDTMTMIHLSVSNQIPV
jgi:hypothetical protein